MGLLAYLLPDVFSGELLTFFTDELAPSATLELDTDDGMLSVSIDTGFLSLGLWIGEIKLGLEFEEGILNPVSTLLENDGFTDYRNEESVYVEFEFAIRYGLVETTTGLDSLLSDLAGLDFGSTALGENFTVAELLNQILVRIVLTNSVKGDIGIKLSANVNIGYIVNNADGDLDILSAIEVGLEITLGTKKVYIVLMGYDSGNGEETPYLFVNLEQIGAPNFRIDLGSITSLFGASEDAIIDSALATADGEEEEEEESGIDIGSLLSNVLSGTYIGIGSRGIAIDLAYNLVANLLGEILTSFTLSDDTLKLLNFVDESTDDTAYVLESEIVNEDKMDNRLYVKINGKYVLYDDGDVLHLAQTERYYKVRSTSITFKTNDPKNNGKMSLNLDIALGLGLDVGLSVYGIRAVSVLIIWLI
jgi:hypothetical protein